MAPYWHTIVNLQTPYIILLYTLIRMWHIKLYTENNKGTKCTTTWIYWILKIHPNFLGVITSSLIYFIFIHKNFKYNSLKTNKKKINNTDTKKKCHQTAHPKNNWRCIWCKTPTFEKRTKSHCSVVNERTCEWKSVFSVDEKVYLPNTIYMYVIINII